MFNTLVLSLPTRNSTLRMRVWRALKDSGCAVLRDGVYLLPAEGADAAVLGRLEAEIRAHGGFAMTLDAKPRSEEIAGLRARFDRTAEYGRLGQGLSGGKASLARL